MDNCIFCGSSDVCKDVFGEGSVTCLKCGMTHFQKQKQSCDNVNGTKTGRFMKGKDYDRT